MSNSASIAAAKKRRSQPANNKILQQNNNNNNNNLIQEKITPLELLKTHDFKVFTLEKEQSIIKKELELLQQNGSQNTNLDNSLENSIHNNDTEIKSLKTITTKLTKDLTEANSLIQTLHATVLSHANITNDFKELKSEFKKLIENKTIEDKEDQEDQKNSTINQDDNDEVDAEA